MRELIKELSKEISIELTEKQTDQFIEYLDFLKEWNEKINLTAIKEEKEIVLKHFIDSLTICEYIKDKEANIIDIGSGAGFPAIPIKIMYPSVKMTMVDSVNKKVSFLNELSNQLKLENCIAVHGRFEDLARGEMRESFDICTARAVAPLNVLIEYAVPFIKKQGKLIAMKGKSENEIDDAKRALKELNSKIEEVNNFTLPFTDMNRSIIIINKEEKTSKKYPRKAGTPSKKPII